MHESFWRATIEELKTGWVYEEEGYRCVICGTYFERGIIFHEKGQFMDAEKAASNHFLDTHGSIEQELLGLGKKQTGLSDVQNDVLSLFMAGETDEHIAKQLGFGSVSTVRQYRFKFREKAKQAKVFLTLMERYEEMEGRTNVHKGAKMVDERWETSKEEEAIFMATYIDEQTGRIKQFPRKEKRKIVILRYLAGKFVASKSYSEKEVSAILKDYYDDFATLRRYLIEYGFMRRNQDGSRYWIEESLGK